MNVFELRRDLVASYAAYIRSFIAILDPRIATTVQAELDAGRLWPEPLIHLNPAFEPGAGIDDLVAEGVLHEACRRVFRIKPDADDAGRCGCTATRRRPSGAPAAAATTS
jgi:hypothetical protein